MCFFVSEIEGSQYEKFELWIQHFQTQLYSSK